jgi:predicted DNA-binding transcriptional regulator YafY
MTGAELARRLEVNVRTIRDYIETLADLGIPVEAERGRNGAYRLRSGYKLPPLIFTEDEAAVLTLSLLMARENGLGQTSLEGALAKIERVLPVSTCERIQAVEQAVVFENSALHVVPATSTVMILSSAVQSGHCVHLCYRSVSADVTERTFDPYGVVSLEGVWYTIGHCHLRQDQRLFRLDRILRLEIMSETFGRPADFDTLASVQRALASVPRVWLVEVWVGAALEEVWRKTQLSKGHFEEMNNGVLIRCEVLDLSWMARLLARLDTPFKIYQPPELRDVLRQYALRMIGYASEE